jgi:hypothetical protein
MNLDANGDPPATSKRRARKSQPTRAPDDENTPQEEEEMQEEMQDSMETGEGPTAENSLNAGDFVPPNYAALGIMAPELTEPRWVSSDRMFYPFS